MNKEDLFDPIRKKYVRATSEEKIRQELIFHMIYDLKFPENYLCVEKDLRKISFLEKKDFPKRRADIICFFKKEERLKPLLLIECKGDRISKNAIEQLIGYNHFVKAYFFCLAGKKEIKTFWYDRQKKEYKHVSFLPTYEQLKNAAENFIG